MHGGSCRQQAGNIRQAIENRIDDGSYRLEIIGGRAIFPAPNDVSGCRPRPSLAPSPTGRPLNCRLLSAYVAARHPATTFPDH
jgi:hypothetical protein